MRPREELTERQREVVKTILAHRQRTGVSPTVRELCQLLGIASTNGVNDHLRLLKRKGVVARRHGVTARGFFVTAEGLRAVGMDPEKCCPKCGHQLRERGRDTLASNEHETRAGEARAADP